MKGLGQHHIDKWQLVPQAPGSAKWDNLPVWMRRPKVEEAQDTATRCRCGCTDVVLVDTEYFTRADCLECDRFRSFVRWEGTDK
jgi:hypothetical protein